MKNLLFVILFSLFAGILSAQTTYITPSAVVHYSGNTYRVVGSANTVKTDTTFCKRIVSQTGDTVLYQLLDSAKSTAYVKGDSLILLYNFPFFKPATLDYQYLQKDTLEDSIMVYGNNKLLNVYVPSAGNAGKGNHDIYFTFMPAFLTSNSSVERFTFTTRKKKPAASTQTPNKWLFNYISQ